ncbi:MAG: electron transfer flavoprotein subunit beta/FixA family protein [Dehalococcoidia bacterium]|nr:MAG: electron transfer flavoprotein subunit beta/FixA family protein [Dehalococcoidia bacterium]UCG84193.1 MAG: electron transfer flavoprotein subunit beta/FixA family protein [Dehalococcoidia bacterium]
MNTIVCVKQVPDCTVVKYDIRTNCLENVHYIMDPIDEISVSEALKIREKNGGEVIAITLGPPRADKVMRSCLKMGVDHAVHLCDDSFDHIDSYATSRILASHISQMKYDLILCGNQSMDEGNGFVGPGIAGYLKLPLVTAVTRIDIFTDTMTAVVHRRLKGGDREIIESPLPAVLTVETMLTSPIYPRLRTILVGLKKDISTMDARALGIDKEPFEPAITVTNISQPKPRLKKTATIDSSMTAQERMRFLMTGGIQQQSSKVVQKSPEAAAADIIQFLIDNGIISQKR